MAPGQIRLYTSAGVQGATPTSTWDQYRKKPVVVKAAKQLLPGEVDTLEGTMKFARGDWLIQGVAGEVYPCRADIFEATYELAAG